MIDLTLDFRVGVTRSMGGWGYQKHAALLPPTGHKYYRRKSQYVGNDLLGGVLRSLSAFLFIYNIFFKIKHLKT